MDWHLRSTAASTCLFKHASVFIWFRYARSRSDRARILNSLVFSGTIYDKLNRKVCACMYVCTCTCVCTCERVHVYTQTKRRLRHAILSELAVSQSFGRLSSTPKPSGRNSCDDIDICVYVKKKMRFIFITYLYLYKIYLYKVYLVSQSITKYS